LSLPPDARRNDRVQPTTRQFYMYILAGKRNGTLYAGVASNLVKRTREHKQGFVEGSTGRYGVKSLVYHAVTNAMREIMRLESEK